MDPELAQTYEGCFILDALRDRGLVEFSGDPDDPADEALVGLAVDEVAHELDVDLEQLRRDLFEVAQAGKSG